MKKRIFAFIPALLLIFINITAFALTPEANFYVNDYTENTISAEHKREMIKRSEFLYSENGVQVVTVVVPMYTGDTIENYTYNVFNSFKIGSKKDDNGVLILLAKEQREIYIAVGDGLAEILSDSATGRIIDNYFIPNVDGDNMDDAIYETHMYLTKACAKLDTEGGVVSGSVDGEDENEFLQIIIIIVIMIIVFSALGGGRGRRRRSGGFGRGVLVGSMMSENHRNYGGSGGGSRGNAGGGGSWGGGGAGRKF